jgi:hypothetical protein
MDPKESFCYPEKRQRGILHISGFHGKSRELEIHNEKNFKESHKKKSLTR